MEQLLAVLTTWMEELTATFQERFLQHKLNHTMNSNHCSNQIGMHTKMGSIVVQQNRPLTNLVWSIDHKHDGSWK
jgi:hypothetical protein